MTHQAEVKAAVKMTSSFCEKHGRWENNAVNQYWVQNEMTQSLGYLWLCDLAAEAMVENGYTIEKREWEK